MAVSFANVAQAITSLRTEIVQRKKQVTAWEKARKTEVDKLDAQISGATEEIETMTTVLKKLEVSKK